LNVDSGLEARLRYASLRMPLAMLELPLYVLLPKLFAALLPLSVVGITLLLARLVDALADPWLGAQWDKAVAWRNQRIQPLALRVLLLSASVYLGGFCLLLWWAELGKALQQGPLAAIAVLAGASCITYLAYSLSTIVYQSWGTALAGTDAGRSRLALTREGLGLLGVMVMSAFLQLDSVEEKQQVTGLLVLASGIALWLLRPLPYPAVPATPEAGAEGSERANLASGDAVWPESDRGADPGWGLRCLLRTPPLRALFACFMLSAIAAAIPATLVLFFIAEVLRLPDSSPIFLMAYFLSAAIGLPVWTVISDKAGQSASWATAMVLAIAAFVFCLQLGEGDALAYAAVCVVTGFALGADLAMPLAILARLIRDHDATHSGEPSIAGRCMGYWTLVGKLNLAIAAGLALPLLEVLGGMRSDPSASGSLSSLPGIEPGVWASNDPHAGSTNNAGNFLDRLIEQLTSASLPSASPAAAGYDPAVLGLIYAGLPCLLKTVSLLLLLRSRRVHHL
jgi:Na+/melibiose symporter-like transporter